MSIEKLNEMMSKHKLIDGMVLNQKMNRQDFVQTLIQKQHHAEIQNFISKQTPTELCSYLETFNVEDAKKLWDKLSPDLENLVLWELSDARRIELAGDRQPDFGQSKINVFDLYEDRLRNIPIAGRKDIELAKPIWVDLINPSKAERIFIGSHFGIELPEPVEATDLEVSARFYVDEQDNIHLHSNFLLDIEGDSRSVPVTFILHGGILF